MCIQKLPPCTFAFSSTRIYPNHTCFQVCPPGGRLSRYNCFSL
nr:MAG TPA: hypothetical protein [Caudoviricetes sp.]